MTDLFRHLRHTLAVRIAVFAFTLVPGGSGWAQDTEFEIRGLRFDALELSRIAPGEHWRAIGFPQALEASEVGRDVEQRRILQFSRPLSRADRRYLLGDIGLRLDVLVEGGYVEHVTLDTIATLLDNGILSASVPYHPAFKLAPSLRDSEIRGTNEFTTEERRNVPGLLLRAVLFPDADRDATAREILDILRTTPGRADVPAEQRLQTQNNQQFGAADEIVIHLVADDPEDLEAGLFRLARIDGINTLEEVGEIVADNENAAGINQSGVKGNRTIWDRLITGTGQVIGVLDKGVPDPNHCLLNAPGKILQTRNISMSAPSDHATFMAASAAGNEVGNPTNAQRGGAWGAQLVLGNANDMYEVKNVRPALTSFTYELNTASLLTFIHSNSWHDSDGFSTTQVLSGYSQRAVDVDLFTWTNENHLVLGSSGPGSGGDTWGPPAIAKNALAVSATSVNDPMTFGAGFATPPSGRIKPDIVAAGCNISSAQLTTIGNTCGATSNACSSSSAATAHAAGTAALVRQYFTDGWYPTGTPQAQDSMIPTGALLKATLINSAQDMTMEPPATNTFPSQREGWGVVTLDHTLFFSGNAPSDRELKVWDVRRADVSPVKALAQGESHSYSVSVEDSSEPLKVTLVWFDYPSSNLSQGAILNDLDLIVTSPPDTNGTVQTYRGNVFVLGSSAQVTTAASRDYKNSVEQVLVNPPTPPGTWTLRVEGTTVQEPASQINVTQGYALVATANFGTPRSNPRPCVDLSWVTTPNGFRISYPRRAGRLCGFVPLDEVCRGIGCPLPCDPRSYCPALRLSLDALRQRFFVAAYDLSRPPTAADREILPATDSLELERREGIEYGIFFFPVDDRRSDGTYDIRILPSE